MVSIPGLPYSYSMLAGIFRLLSRSPELSVLCSDGIALGTKGRAEEVTLPALPLAV